MHDAANDAPIIRPLNTSHICRQMGLNPIPLLIAQPKEVCPHDPDPPTNQVAMQSGLPCHRSKINEFRL
jgi:hypothetical protein